MFMDRERRLSNRNGTPQYSNGKFRDDDCYGGFLDRFENSREKSPSRSKILRIPSPTSSPPPSSSSPPFPGSNSPDRGYIDHRVSKFDTLAGIAIKYGVEVNLKKRRYFAMRLGLLFAKVVVELMVEMNFFFFCFHFGFCVLFYFFLCY